MRQDLIKQANAGLPLSDILIIDMHAHMGPYWNFHIPFNDATGMLVSMDALGIDTTLVCPHVSIGPDCVAGNDMSQEAAMKYPGRFLGAIGLNPNYPDSILPEIRRFENSETMKAIKLHPSLHNYAADGEAYRCVYAAAAERGLPVATHTWYGDKKCSPKMYSKLAGEYPDTIFVLVHSGGAMEGVEEAIEAASGRENVYLETSGSMTFGIVERLVRGVGSEKVVFGSDNPFIDPAAQVGKVVYAPITEEDKLDVLGLNAKRILRL